MKISVFVMLKLKDLIVSSCMILKIIKEETSDFVEILHLLTLNGMLNLFTFQKVEPSISITYHVSTVKMLCSKHLSLIFLKHSLVSKFSNLNSYNYTESQLWKKKFSYNYTQVYLLDSKELTSEKPPLLKLIKDELS